MGKKKILIAEDHTLVRKGLRSLLTPNDAWEIVGEAVDGLDAIRRVQQHLILHVSAAECGIVGHAGNRPVLRCDDPVFPGLEFHRRAVGTLQHVAVNQS